MNYQFVNYLRQGFTDTLKAVWNRKLFFSLLVVFQLLFFVVLGYIFIHFQLRMIDNYQQIAAPLEEIDSNTKPDAELMQTIGAIYERYQQLMKDLRSLVWWLGVMFLVHGGIWAMHHQFLERYSWKERMKRMIQQWLRMLVSSLALLGPILVVSYFILRDMIFKQADIDAVTSTAKILGAVAIVMYYFLLVAFSLLDVGWRQFPRRFFNLGIRKIHKTISVLLLNFAVVGLSLWLLYESLAQEWSFWAVFVATLVFVNVLVFSRLFLISMVKHL